MNTCAIKQNLGNVIVNYILTLAKCETLHSKLEKLYLKMSGHTSYFIKKNILKINNSLNKLLVEIMNYQWIIELMT